MAGDQVDAATVRAILLEATRAPSAHNAQPWRVSEGKGRLVVWYADSDRLLADPDDRDGLMAMGAFLETFRLAAAARGVRVASKLALRRVDEGLVVAEVRLGGNVAGDDPLVATYAQRQCNRAAYARVPLPPALGTDLKQLGCVLLDPARVAPLVTRASVLAWRDSRFIRDLALWTRFTDRASDGMTVDCLDLSRSDQWALRFALRRGGLPAPVARLYASRDRRLTLFSGAMVALLAADRDPATLLDCGRRLVRAWITINATGHSWHPMSIVIDQPETAAELSRRLGGLDVVALFRAGFTTESAPWSGRRPLEQVLVPLADATITGGARSDA